MEKVYFICMLLGIVFPLLSIVCNVFDDFFDAVFEGLDSISGADFDLWFLPLSANSIFGFLLFFGGTGRLLSITRIGGAAVFWLSVLVGYAGAVLIQFMIHKLKKVESPSIDITDLLMYEGKVENEIAEQGYGSVSFWIDNRIVTYPAVSMDGARIPQETTIRVKELRGQNVLAVERTDALERKYS